MLKRALVVLAFLLMPMVANAGAPVPFDANEFTAAQTAGRTILVQVHADWCPACAAQRPIIVGLASTDQFSNIIIFNIDYDTQKDLVSQFEAPGQSTLIVYKGATETGRDRGLTSREDILALLTTGL